MPTNTSGGTTTSFNNTPQAKDDLFTAYEDGIFTFDVMANDLGGNAKVLWSIDDTNMTDDSGNGTYDLLAKDAAMVPEYSDLGARIWIENGVIKYDSNPIDYLALGQQVVDKFTYAIRMSNGTLSWATVYITLTGTNDVVSITSALGLGAVVEDSAQTPSSSDSNQASGTISFTDQDLADTHTATAAAAASNTTSLGTFALGAVNEAANAANGSVGWTYTINEAAAQYLAAGQTVTEVYVVTINDGHGSIITQNVTVTITGTNDQPDIRAAAGDTASAMLNETNSGLAKSGTLTVTDVDTSDTISTAVTLTNVTGPTGGPTNAQLLAMFSVTPASGLAANTGDTNNLTWNFNSGSEPFNYLAVGQSLQLTYTLTVSDGNGGSDTQAVTLTITGTNDVVTIGSSTVSGAVVEDSALTPSPTDSNQASGTIGFSDLDLADAHSASFVASGSNTTSLGSFALGAVSEAPNATNGTVGWTYTINEAAAQYLAAGQTVTEIYVVTIDDGNGSTVTQNVSVTITGTNDSPTVSAADLSGAVTEDASDPTLSDTGTITFDDLDLTDTHSTNVTADPGNSLGGSLLASVTDPATGVGDGTVTWNYSVPNANVQYLGVGETATETFTVRISDNNGGYIDQVVTVTVTGTNDAPELTVDASGSVTEDAADPALTDSGTLSFTDADVTDTHSVSSSYNGDALWSGGSLSAGQITAITSGFSADSDSWDYSVANSAVQFLGAGETITLSFNVTVTDDSGALNDSDTEVVTITITGTNDAPELTVDASGSVTEDAANPTLTDSGTLSFTDADVTDTHNVSSVYNGDAVWSGGSLSAGQITAITSGFSADSNSWDYSVANAAVQFLGAGDTITLSFNVTVTDDSGALNNSDTEVVTITITGTNDDPTVNAADLVGAVTEDASDPTLSDTGTIAFDDLDLTDTHSTNVTADAGNTLGGSLLASVTDPATGAGDGTVTWSYSVPNANVQYLGVGETASETFTVRISDNNGGYVDQVVTVTVTGTNDDPDIRAEGTDSASATIPEANAGLLADGTLTVTDADTSDVVSTSIALTGVSGNQGALSNAALLAMLSVTPDTGLAANTGDSSNLAWNFNSGSEAFNYLAPGQSLQLTYTLTVSDGQGGTDTQDVTVTIQGTNDAPVLSGDLSASINESGTYQLTLADVNFTDPDDNAANVTFTASGLSNGTLFVNGIAQNSFTGQQLADGLVTFTHNGSETLSAGFSISVDDGNEDSSAPVAQPFSFTVTPVNDAPVNSVPGGQSVDEDTALLFSTGNANTISIADSDAGSGTVEVTLSVASGTLTLGSLSGLSITGGANGSSTVTVQGTLADINAGLQGLSYQGNLNFFGGDTLSIVTSDLGNSGLGGALGDTDSVAITVNVVNDAPVAAPVTLTAIAEDSGGRIITQAELLAGVTDVDGPPATITSLSIATGGGSLVSNGNGTWTYTPALNDDSWVTFNYTASDGSLSSSSIASLDITPVNDALVASPVTLAAIAEDSGARIITQAELLAGVTDVDSLSLSITALSIGTGGGSLVSNGNGTWTYTPALDDDTSVTFNYTASDGSLTANSTATMDITPVDDRTAPTDIRLTTATPAGNMSFSSFQFSGTLFATDPDPGAISFTIVSQSDAGLFSVSGNTLTSGNLNQNDQFTVTIRATQAGDPAILFTEETFGIITGSNGANTDDNNVAGLTGDDVLYGNGGNDMIFGFAGNDTLFGQNGNDRLYGGNGNDILNGGAGNDFFIFDTTPNDITNHDIIQDFNANNADKIHLENSIFGAFGSFTGALSSTNFISNAGGVAGDGNDYILFDTATGNLYYDADGNGAGARVLIATLTVTAGTLDPTDILIV